jgi:hypothetical protein
MSITLKSFGDIRAISSYSESLPYFSRKTFLNPSPRNRRPMLPVTCSALRRVVAALSPENARAVAPLNKIGFNHQATFARATWLRGIGFMAYRRKSKPAMAA